MFLHDEISGYPFLVGTALKWASSRTERLTLSREWETGSQGLPSYLLDSFPCDWVFNRDISSFPANSGDVRDARSIPGLGRSPGGGHGNLLQYSCLENPMDTGAWWATVHGIAKSQTQLSNLLTWRTLYEFSFHFLRTWYLGKGLIDCKCLNYKI